MNKIVFELKEEMLNICFFIKITWWNKNMYLNL